MSPQKEYQKTPRWQAYIKAYRKTPGYKSKRQIRREKIEFEIRRKTRSKSQTAERQQIVLNHYGNRCTCCGEDHKEFLTIDHINGGGTKHKKELRLTGKKFYKWIIDNNFPDDLQILCMNCNWVRGRVGYCPHEKEGYMDRIGW